MAVTQTTRFAVYQWSAGADPFTRAQMGTSLLNLENEAGGWTSGTYAARPAAAAAQDRFLYYATDARAFFWCDGSAWLPFGEIDQMTTTQRDALVAGGKWDGRLIYNTTTAQLEIYSTGTAAWAAAAGAGGGSFATQVKLGG